jgi:SanA protein
MNFQIKNIFSAILWLFYLLAQLFFWLLLLIILLVMIILASNLWVEYQTKDRLYSDVNTIPAKKVALILGTGKHLRYGRINRYFKYRIDAVVKLYKAGKIKHIIASGDNRTIYHNEPVDMQKSLIEQGIPKEAISLDYAGFRTLDSVVRCKEIFSQDDIIIVSQGFHNKRAIFISDYYEIKAIGFNARDLSFYEGKKVLLREYFARFKAVLDLYILKTKPKFLGEKIQIPDY